VKEYVLEKDRRLAEAVASGEPLYCVQCGQRGCTSCPEPPYMDALRKVAYSQSSAVAAPRRMPVEPTEGPRHTREAPDAVPTSKAPSVDAVLAQVAPKRGPPQHIAELLNALEAEVLGGEAHGESAASPQIPSPPRLSGARSLPPPPPPPPKRGGMPARSRSRSRQRCPIPVGERSSDLAGQPTRARPGHPSGPRSGTRGGKTRGIYAAKYGGGNHPTNDKGKGKGKGKGND
jgi:hypothetical protein